MALERLTSKLKLWVLAKSIVFSVLYLFIFMIVRLTEKLCRDVSAADTIYSVRNLYDELIVFSVKGQFDDLGTLFSGGTVAVYFVALGLSFFAYYLNHEIGAMADKIILYNIETRGSSLARAKAFRSGDVSMDEYIGRRILFVRGRSVSVLLLWVVPLFLYAIVLCFVYAAIKQSALVTMGQTVVIAAIAVLALLGSISRSVLVYMLETPKYYCATKISRRHLD